MMSIQRIGNKWIIILLRSSESFFFPFLLLSCSLERKNGKKENDFRSRLIEKSESVKIEKRRKNKAEKISFLFHLSRLCCCGAFRVFLCVVITRVLCKYWRAQSSLNCLNRSSQLSNVNVRLCSFIDADAIKICWGEIDENLNGYSLKSSQAKPAQATHSAQAP